MACPRRAGQRVFIGIRAFARWLKVSYCTRMPGQQDEIEALKTQVAALTARVFHLEQHGGVYPAAPAQSISAEQHPPAVPSSDATVSAPPAYPTGAAVIVPIQPATSAPPLR